MIEIVHVAIDDSSNKRHTGIIAFDRIAGGKLLVPSGNLFPSDPTPGELFWNIASGALYRRTDANTDWAQAGAGAPAGAQYLVLSTDSTLTNERVLTPGTGIVVVDGGAGSTYVISVDNSIVAMLTGAAFTGPVSASAGISLVSSSIRSAKTIGFDREYDNGNCGGQTTINWNNGQKQVLTLTASVTASFASGANPPNVGNYLLRIVQGPTGGPFGIQWPSASIAMWAGASAPTLSSGSGKIDICTFYYNGNQYFGVASLNFA